MAIQNIIFDWDGTLAKTLDLWREGYQIAFDRRGFRFTPEEIVKEFYYNHDQVPLRHPDIDFPPIVDETRDHVFQSISGVALYDGALDVLGQLHRRGVTLALVTSSPRRSLNGGLQAHDLGGFFASIVTGDDGFGHKPDPLPFAQTLDRIGAKPAETLIIGDAAVDVQAGQAVGCQTCWFAPAQNRLFHDFDQVRALEPDHEIATLNGLVALV